MTNNTQKQVTETNWNILASAVDVKKTASALQRNGITAYITDNESEAVKTVLSLIPKGSEVMIATSQTLEALGITKEINESGKYNSVTSKLMSMDKKTEHREMQKLGAAPEYVVGSVHAITEDGKIVIASATGSQLPSYAYGADHVIWVVGTQKIVKNLDEAWVRLNDHVLPLESERAKKAYGVPGSAIAKLLVFNKEFTPNRVHVVFVNKHLGF